MNIYTLDKIVLDRHFTAKIVIVLNFTKLYLSVETYFYMDHAKKALVTDLFQIW